MPQNVSMILGKRFDDLGISVVCQGHFCGVYRPVHLFADDLSVVRVGAGLQGMHRSAFHAEHRLAGMLDELVEDFTIKNNILKQRCIATIFLYELIHSNLYFLQTNFCLSIKTF